MSRAYLVTCDRCAEQQIVPDVTTLPYDWASVTVSTVGLEVEGVQEDFEEGMHLCGSCRLQVGTDIANAIRPRTKTTRSA